jgi:hypothetical protein
VPLLPLTALVAVVVVGSAVTTGVSGRVMGRIDAARLRDL